MNRAARLRRTSIPPLQAFLFALGLSVALAAVLVPVLPGETPLEAGDVAFKTFADGGQVIAEEGDVVSAAELTRIRDAGLLDNKLSATDAVAAIIVAVVSSALLAIYLSMFQPAGMNTLRRLVMFGLLIVLWVGASKVFLSLTLPDEDRLFLAYMLPVAAAAMLTVALLDGGLAIVVAALLAVLVSFAGFYMPDARNAASTGALEPLQMVLTFFLGGVAGVLTVRQAERVNRYVFAGVSTGLVSFAILFAFWLLMPGRDEVDVAWMIVSAALGGFGSSILALGGTVTLGVMFGVTTRIQLMELSQLSHPLLRRLQEDTPGTFHHSMQVGTLAERAADRVGADPLLARVGAYFHDIGKVENPQYYIENQLDGVNPHDALDPETSAKMIFEHVKQGLKLTRKHRVPPRVRAFVPEHHGTRLVTYFYRKANAVDPATDGEKYRYPGPRPQSPETGIVMLADSVEAVVRASEDHSFEKIDEIVDQVVAERIAEGQMDDCDLTMRDLRTIAETFKSTLHGIYHKRIEYPPAASDESTKVGDRPKRTKSNGSGRRPVKIEN
jgi:putative nucleotidyltransferase with HDIG domain